MITPERLYEHSFYYDPLYDLTTIRQASAHNSLGHFSTDIQIDATTGIRYSAGIEWHRELPNQKSKNLFYRVNNDNQHWYENEQNPDVVTLGCSFTAGSGLPVEYTWPSIYRSITGQTVNNVSKPGHTLTSMVDAFFQHTATYGLPKKIFVLVSDPMRYWFQPENTVVQWDREGRAYVGRDRKKMWTHRDSVGNEVVLSPDLVVSENLRSLDQLLRFAEACNICVECQLVSPYVQRQFELSGYKVAVRHFGQGGQLPTDQDQALFWEYGFDFIQGEDFEPHPGLWTQLQWASAFLGRPVTVEEQSQLKCWATHLFDHSAATWKSKRAKIQP